MTNGSCQVINSSLVVTVSHTMTLSIGHLVVKVLFLLFLAQYLHFKSTVKIPFYNVGCVSFYTVMYILECLRYNCFETSQIVSSV